MQVKVFLKKFLCTKYHNIFKTNWFYIILILFLIIIPGQIKAENTDKDEVKFLPEDPEKWSFGITAEIWAIYYRNSENEDGVYKKKGISSGCSVYASKNKWDLLDGITDTMTIFTNLRYSSRFRFSDNTDAGEAEHFDAEIKVRKAFLDRSDFSPYWILGASYTYRADQYQLINSYYTHYRATQTNEIHKRVNFLTLFGGYGYALEFSKKWLFRAEVLLNISNISSKIKNAIPEYQNTINGIAIGVEEFISILYQINDSNNIQAGFKMRYLNLTNNHVPGDGMEGFFILWGYNF